jgi:hypothetical protein
LKEIKLPSGAILKISNIPFATAKALYQAILEENRSLTVGVDLKQLIKDMICIGFSSQKIDLCMKECLSRCIYNDGKGDLKIDDSTFESEKARADYVIVCLEVMQETVAPFMKGLSVAFDRALSMVPSIQT